MQMEGMSRGTFDKKYNYRCEQGGEKHCINCVHSGWDCGQFLNIYRIGPEQCFLLKQCGAIVIDVNLNNGLCDLWQGRNQ